MTVNTIKTLTKVKRNSCYYVILVSFLNNFEDEYPHLSTGVCGQYLFESVRMSFASFYNGKDESF